jgi:dihydrofolate reductase
MTEESLQWKAIAAMASNRVIGREGQLPWRLPDDLKWFKKLTLGHPIIMGRSTYESIGSKPLPGRRNIVLSRSGFDPGHPDVEVLPSVEALRARVAELNEDVFLIGGAAIYEALLADCDTLYLSFISEAVEGDAFFPSFEEDFDLAEVVASYPEFELRRYKRRKSENSSLS